MNISNKKLKKALEHYQNSDYEAALKICEKFLEKDYSNEEALFLEGDILYKLGRIDDAIVTWKINSEYNNNEEATNRLAAVDKERKAQALSYTNIQNMSSEDRVLLENAYRENIELKRQVEGSPLLKDSENNNSQVTPEKKAETKTSENETNTDDAIFAPIEEKPSKEYAVIDTNIDEIIQSKASKNQVTHEFETMELEELRDKLKHLEDPAKNNSKDVKKDLLSKDQQKSQDQQDQQEQVVLEEVKTSSPKMDETISKVNSATEKTSTTNATISESTAQKNSSSKKKVIIPIIAVAALIVVIGGAYIAISSNSPKQKELEAKPSVTDTTQQEATKPSESNKPAPKVLDATAAAQFNSDVNYLVSANSIDGIAALLTNNPKDTIPQSSMASYDKALNFMQTTGINYYYENGMNAYNNNDYSTAISYFAKAIPFGENDFREPTMLFLTAVSYQKSGDTTQALDAYKNFIKEYPNSESYTPEALYYLATYYSQHNDDTLAKQYASELQTNFASSIYNNDNIKNILK